jgi:hypothetical protein
MSLISQLLLEIVEKEMGSTGVGGWGVPDLLANKKRNYRNKKWERG